MSRRPATTEALDEDPAACRPAAGFFGRRGDGRQRAQRRRRDRRSPPPPRNWSFPGSARVLALAGFVCSTTVANATSTDATLRALSLKDRDGTAVAYSPGFNPATTSYTANAPARVDRITVEGTRNDDGATVVYLDADDQTLTDADTVAAGLQELAHAGNRLRDVSVLRELPQLVWLRLARNPIADSSPLGPLPVLRVDHGQGAPSHARRDAANAD